MALFFPSMIARVASSVGMKVPDLSRAFDEYDREEYPHFHVFCNVTLGQPLNYYSWEIWAKHNAKVIVELDDVIVRRVTLAKLVDLGLELT
jgi:hypothetical protein